MEHSPVCIYPRVYAVGPREMIKPIFVFLAQPAYYLLFSALSAPSAVNPKLFLTAELAKYAELMSANDAASLLFAFLSALRALCGES